MELQVILMFLLTLMFIIVTAWSLGTFLRLDNASKKYNNNKVFEFACQVSKEYVTIGIWFGAVSLLLSLMLFAFISYIVYKNYQ